MTVMMIMEILTTMDDDAGDNDNDINNCSK